MSHHPPVFALFLFYEKKTCTKRKVGRGIEPALSARTNRSRAPTTSSRAVLAPPSTPHWFRASAVLKPNLHVFAHGSNTKSSVVLHCFPHHSGFRYRRSFEQETWAHIKPSPWRGRWVRRTRMRGARHRQRSARSPAICPNTKRVSCKHLPPPS